MYTDIIPDFLWPKPFDVKHSYLTHFVFAFHGTDFSLPQVNTSGEKKPTWLDSKVDENNLTDENVPTT